MGTLENKLVVRRFIEEVVNTGDLDRLPEFIAPDFRELNASPESLTGIEHFREHILSVRSTYPDLHLTVGHQIAEGELVATRLTMTGTHRGGWPTGAKPANRLIQISAVNINRIRNGLIVEHDGAANELAAFLEIGVVRVESG
jgi:predicted ester cyclase